MDVDWQATGSRSELWDRRQVFNKNRMGAQALSRAREGLRPRGHSCLCRNGLGVSTRFTLRLRTFEPGYTGESLLPIMHSQQALPKFVMRFSVSKVTAEGNQNYFDGSDSRILITHCSGELQRQLDEFRVAST